MSCRGENLIPGCDSVCMHDFSEGDRFRDRMFLSHNGAKTKNLAWPLTDNYILIVIDKA
jgi:hypothetical protein